MILTKLYKEYQDAKAARAHMKTYSGSVPKQSRTARSYDLKDEFKRELFGTQKGKLVVAENKDGNQYRKDVLARNLNKKQEAEAKRELRQAGYSKVNVYNYERTSTAREYVTDKVKSAGSAIASRLKKPLATGGDNRDRRPPPRSALRGAF